MRELLKDVVSHMAWGNNTIIRVTGTETETKFSTIDVETKSVVVYGTALKPLEQFAGDWGMRDPAAKLMPILEFPNHKDDAATWTFKHKRDTKIPVELVVADKDGMATGYRLLAQEAMPKIPSFKAPDWDVVVKPEREKVSEFNSRVTLADSAETDFAVDTEDGELRMYFGEPDTSDYTTMIFAKTDGELGSRIYFPIKPVQSVLKFINDGDMTLSLTGRGALLITLETNHVQYEFAFAARKK